MKVLRTLALFFVMSFHHSSFGMEMNLMLPDFPPYTYLEDGTPAGLGVDALIPILDAMEVQYHIKVASNHGRALHEVIAGRSDGFFMASRNEERDKHAIFSESILKNKWVWVLKQKGALDVKSASFKENSKTASLLNTNTEKWLKSNGFKTTASSKDVQGLLKVLDAGRVDAIFVSEAVLLEEVSDLGNLNVIVEVEKDFGFYVSKSFLEKHPTFMKELNEQILAAKAD